MAMRGFIPQYLGSQNSEGKISYRLEYLYLTALNELFVFLDYRAKSGRKS